MSLFIPCGRGAPYDGPYREHQCRSCWLYNNDGKDPAALGIRAYYDKSPPPRHREHDPPDIPRPEEPPLLGDLVASALKIVGITPERIGRWLGGCGGCGERQAKLNALHRWAKRVLSRQKT